MDNNYSNVQNNVRPFSNNYNNLNQPVNKPKNNTKKVLIIIFVVIFAFIALIAAFFWYVSSTSNKLVCKSKEGNITIMYDDSSITGYVASGITYDMDQQSDIVDIIGIDSYISQFKVWFEENTTGTCSIKEK